MKASTSYLIKQVGDKLTNLLLEKNADYGDSATQGESIFATRKNMVDLTPKQFGLCCRIDDKLHRIKNGGITIKTVDSLWDLAGYFILLIIAMQYGQEQTIEKTVEVETKKVSRGEDL
jgi:hypothetical protein